MNVLGWGKVLLFSLGADIGSYGLQRVHGHGNASPDEKKEGSHHNQVEIGCLDNSQHKGRPPKGEDDADIRQDKSRFAADPNLSVQSFVAFPAKIAHLSAMTPYGNAAIKPMNEWSRAAHPPK